MSAIDFDSLKGTDWTIYDGPEDTQICVQVKGTEEERKEVLRRLNKLIMAEKDNLFKDYVKFVDSSD